MTVRHVGGTSSRRPRPAGSRPSWPTRRPASSPTRPEPAEQAKPDLTDLEPTEHPDEAPSLADHTDGDGSYDASAITVLEGLEAVRKRPGMYIGSTGERGLHHLVHEVVDNSVDEALAGYCDTIDVTLLADGGVRVVDDGRGIPVDIVAGEGRPAVEVVLTVLHAGGKFGGSGYAVSGGLHGVGVSVVNALSTAARGRGPRPTGRTCGTQDVHDGRARTPRSPRARPPTSTGTTVTFWANADIFETTEYDFETLRTRFQQMAFLNKGLTITLTDERPGHADTSDDGLDGGSARLRTVTYKYDDGLSTTSST